MLKDVERGSIRRIKKLTKKILIQWIVTNKPDLLKYIPDLKKQQNNKSEH